MREPDTEHPMFDGIARRYSFANGYGASVIRHQHSYGGPDGEWELAVLKGDCLYYDTPITDDVIGRLTDSEVDELLERIEKLPKQQEAVNG